MKTLSIIALLLFASPLFAAPEDDFLKLGKERLNSGKYDKAVQLFTRVVKINPANAEAQKGLGIAFFHLGDNRVAINPEVLGKSVVFLLEAARLSPESDTLYYLGLALLDLGYKDDSAQVCDVLQTVDAEKANLLSSKIAAFKEPEQYIYLRNEHNLNEERKEYLEAAEEQQRQEQLRNEQAKLAKARAEQQVRQRMIAAIEDARRAAEEAAYRARNAEIAAQHAESPREYKRSPSPGLFDDGRYNRGAINPRTGEYYAPAGRGYIGTRDGTYYEPAGPAGVINTRTGEFMPRY